MHPIIKHVWTPEELARQGIRGIEDFTVEELARIGQASGVTRFNLVQMTWYVTDHRYIAEAIAKNPKRFVGTGIVPAVTDVSGPSPDATMRALAKQGIVAFRIRGRSTRPPLGDGERWLVNN